MGAGPARWWYTSTVRRGERRTGPHAAVPAAVTERLFVYGTLRRGQTAYPLLQPHVRTSAPAHLRGSMYAFAAGYPGVILDGDTSLQGEVVEVDDLEAVLPVLDAYEGEEFTRVQTEVEGPGGLVRAWVYVLADPGTAAGGTLVPSGDWVAWSAA